MNAPARHFYSRTVRYGDGNGVSTQDAIILVGPDAPNAHDCAPDPDRLVDTGIVHHWASYSSAPTGEAEDAQPWGASDLKGLMESTYEFRGQHYADFDAAVAAYDAAQESLKGVGTFKTIGELAEKVIDEIARDRIEGRDHLLPSDFPETEAK